MNTTDWVPVLTRWAKDMKIYLWTISVIFAIMAIITFLRRVLLLSSGVRATGKFVRWEVRRKRGGPNNVELDMFYPVISFQAIDGKEYEVLGPGGSIKGEANSYPLIYFQRKPEKAKVFSVQGFWAAPPAFFILALGSAYVAYDM